MPDIAMCQRDDCPRCQECYRFRAIPFKYQSYSCFEPEGCEYFWPIAGRTDLAPVRQDAPGPENKEKK